MTIGVILTMVSLTIAGSIFFQTDNPPAPVDETSSELPVDEGTDFESFGSFSEMQGFIKDNREMNQGYWRFPNLDSTGHQKEYGNTSHRYEYDKGVVVAATDADSLSEGGSSYSNDYSTTNIQEEGVDEGDVVKNDGGYAYIASADRKQISILDVYPAKDSGIVSTIDVDPGTVQEMYLTGDKLVVLGTIGETYYYGYYGYYYEPRQSPDRSVFVKVYDISSREDPVLFREDRFEGNYVDSRMIGGNYYLISNQYEWEIDSERNLTVPISEIRYVDQFDPYYSYFSVSSLNVHEKMAAPSVRTMLLGGSSEIYVSERNIYITQHRYKSWVEDMEEEMDEVLLPLLPAYERGSIETIQGMDIPRTEKMERIDNVMGEYLDSMSESQKDAFHDTWTEARQRFNAEGGSDREITAIHRISLSKGHVNLKASGSVPGYILNRYSMGEYNGYFRLATTVRNGNMWWGWGFQGSEISNNVFVLDMDLMIVGNITGIAPKESIYSARFMGERAYLVTFEKVDPFFVIDLSDPMDPKILGELKIPGYSDYLHPYDENHVIGLGKDTVESGSGDFSWYQGVKLSLFDVTDLENPKELSKFIIGDRGTYSLAQSDPHAFLFSLSKNLLVIPINYFQLNGYDLEPNAYGEYIWTGAYVFDVTTDDGFVLKGRISHSDEPIVAHTHYGYGNDVHSIYRSFYIDDVIYTVSQEKLMASDMASIDEIANVILPYTEPVYHGYYD